VERLARLRRITIQWLESLEAFQAFCAEPTYAELILPDEEKFLDKESLVWMMTEEPMVTSTETSRDRLVCRQGRPRHRCASASAGATCERFAELGASVMVADRDGRPRRPGRGGHHRRRRHRPLRARRRGRPDPGQRP